MKYVVALIFSLSLVSCDSKQLSDSKDCTFNGGPVNCSETNSETESNQTILKAQVTSKIMIFNDFMEIKERDTNFAREIIDGREYYCEASTAEIQGLFFHFDEKNLYLRIKELGESIVYEKVDGPKNELYGQWRNTVEDSDQTDITTLHISEGSIQIITECIFKD